jgi:sugar lactone lactonase YvrE
VRGRRVGSEAVVVDCRIELGEGPVWDEAAGLLHWVDLFTGTVFSFDPATGSTRSFVHGGPLGAVAPRAGGGLVLAADKDLVATDLDGGGATVLATVEPDNPVTRFNDCRIDPAGRFFGGTMTENGVPGAVHRIGPDLVPEVVIPDTALANGIGWSPDGRTLYFVDSPLQRLDAYEFDPATGDLGARRTVVTIDPDEGFPDGLAVDAEGGIWIGFARGHTVRRYTPEGHLDQELCLPVRNPTCPAFGGPDLATLFITSAHLRSNPRYADDSDLAGALFALEVGVPGLPSPAFTG